jgi:hypothetical protein
MTNVVRTRLAAILWGIVAHRSISMFHNTFILLYSIDLLEIKKLIQLRVSNYIFATHYRNLSGETVPTFDLSGIPGGLVMDGLVSIAILHSR